MTGMLRRPRGVALGVIALLVGAASLVSFAESYRGLLDWASRHGLHGAWAVLWPLQIDTFVAVGELALFVALADSWSRRSRIGAWAVTMLGLAASVAANVGHVAGHSLTNRATAAVPPLAAAAALAVGLGVLKRVVASRSGSEPETGNGIAGLAVVSADLVPVPTDAETAAMAAFAASVAGGNALSQNQLMARFRLTRAQATKVRQTVLAASNGHDPE